MLNKESMFLISFIWLKKSKIHKILSGIEIGSRA